MIFKRFLPRQENFFALFTQAAEKLFLTASAFSNLLQHLTEQQVYVDEIAKHEAEADEIAHITFECLHKTFITPFDRNDIHKLTSSLDDIIDLINRCAQRFPFFELQTVPDELISLSRLSTESTIHIKEAVSRLHSLKNTKEIFYHCNQIDHVESKAHQIVLIGEKNLYLYENDFKQFIKLKEIYANVKMVINRSQDVANLIKGIVLEYS